MKIGQTDLGHRPLVLAPMEDVTDPSFRLLCREMGAAMATTEFVSAEALVRDVPSTMRKLAVTDAERPVGIQIYGRDPEAMVQAARIVEQAGPEVIDLNFGCPVKRVAGKGAGAGMLREPEKLLDITRRVVNAVSLPVTVKTRLGWDHEHKIIKDLALRLQDCGIKALTVHGRTRSQMYTGEADWALIGELKQMPSLEIPVIGNGDICTPAQALEAFDTYGVDGVMVGRASFGAPWVFTEMRGLLDTGILPVLSPHAKMEILRRQLRESVDRAGEYGGILHVRRHLAATPLLKGLPDFRPTRIRMLRALHLDELLEILDEIEEKYLCE